MQVTEERTSKVETSLLMYTLEGVSSVSNFITAYEESQ